MSAKMAANVIRTLARINQTYSDMQVCVLPSSFRGMRAFIFQNRKEILNTTLLTKTRGSKHKYHIQLLKNDANESQAIARINLYEYSWLK